MINLIPKKEKQKITIGFYYRLMVLFLCTIDFCVFILIACLLPSYFFSFQKNVSVNLKLEAQAKEPLPLVDEQSLVVIKEVNSKLDLIDKDEKNKFLPSFQVINAVLLKKGSNIKITQIFYENDSAKGRKISLTGTAPSREVLLSFRRALEASSDFKTVDLPISSFVKGSNIQFSLSLTPA
jgi:hypothetical protein